MVKGSKVKVEFVLRVNFFSYFAAGNTFQGFCVISYC